MASRIEYTGASYSKHPKADADKEGLLSWDELQTHKSKHEALKNEVVPIEQQGERNEPVCTMYVCRSVSCLNRSR